VADRPPWLCDARMLRLTMGDGVWVMMRSDKQSSTGARHMSGRTILRLIGLVLALLFVWFLFSL